MKINTRTLNMGVTPEITDYLSKKLEATGKFTKGVDQSTIIVDVELGKESNHHKSGDIFKAEINFCIGRDCIRAVSEKDDLHAAIDEAKDELLGELRVKKRKRVSGIRKGGQKMKAIIRGLWNNKDNGQS